MSKRFRFPAYVVLLATLALSSCAPKIYTLNLSPPSQVGWQFSLVTDIAEKSGSHALITIPGVSAPQNDERSEEFVGHLEGEGEVLAVYANGGIQKLAVTVKSIQAVRSGKPVAHLPAAGAKIVIGRQGESMDISVDGKPVENSVADVLDELILLDDGKATDQQIFGPKTPIKIGDTWPVDAKGAADVLKSGLGGDSNTALGSMKFASVSGSGNNQSATLTGDFSLAGYKPGLPTTMKLDSGGIKGTMSWTVPTTAAKGTNKFSRDFIMNIEAHGNPNDTAVRLTVTGEQKRSVEIAFH